VTKNLSLAALKSSFFGPVAAAKFGGWGRPTAGNGNIAVLTQIFLFLALRRCRNTWLYNFIKLAMIENPEFAVGMWTRLL